MPKIELIQGDCLEKMKDIPDGSVDAIITDPPYGLSFMGKEWDKGVPGVHFWQEMIRVLKPGGYLLSFSGTRTYHRMATAIEDGGFEIRDMIEWVYGCLSEDTEILTINGWEYYHKDIVSSPVLCCNIDNDSFEFQKPTRDFIYENKHTAYRIKSDTTDQIVSRNHRVLVERGGKLVFKTAETLERQEDIPFLESLSDLPETIYNPHEGTGVKKQDLLTRVQECDFKRQTQTPDNTFNDSNLSSLWKNISNKKKQAVKILLTTMQWKDKGSEFNSSQIRQNRNEVSGNGIKGCKQSCVERWSNLFQEKGKLCFNKICEMSVGVFSNGTEGRLYYGTSLDNGSISGAVLTENRSSTSYQSRSAEQQAGELDAIPDKQSTQIIRRTRATITEIEYSGKVWCVEVPTGAFVARRNGQIFITGNSGFPKSLNIGKKVDQLQGNEREVVGEKDNKSRASGVHGGGQNTKTKTDPITKGTSEWEGWGTALKPAHEPICMARKPLSEKTVATNVLKWGTGGINIDESRVGTEVRENPQYGNGGDLLAISKGGEQKWDGTKETVAGRFPANLIHDGSEEVRECFPSPHGAGVKRDAGTAKQDNAGSLFLGDKGSPNNGMRFGDSGNASRFFKSIIYQAKASKKERNAGCEGLENEKFTAGNYSQSPVCKTCNKTLNGTNDHSKCSGEVYYREMKSKTTSNNHPTVKPIALMEYLINMVTKEGGTVLDPFMGSGTTGVACNNTGRNFIGIELDPEYFKIANHRIFGDEIDD